MAIKMRMAKEQYLNKIEEALMEKASVEIQIMIDRKTEELISKFKERLENAKITIEQYVESRNTTIEDIRKEINKEAAREVKRDLVLDAIGEKKTSSA